MASTFILKECASSGLASSIGTANGKTLRTICSSVSISVVVGICTVLVFLFYMTNQKRWIVNMPIWVGIGYGMIFAPLDYHFNNISELSYLDSGMTKSEWINHIASDGRVRMSVIASLSAAVIVSANAWISRIESKN
jgi:hypothetical protein